MREINPTPDPALRTPLGSPMPKPAPAPAPLKPVTGRPGIVVDEKGRWQTDPGTPKPNALRAPDPDSDHEAW